MKERPIIFNSSMVKAILEGRKTQTRLVMRRQPDAVERFKHAEETTDTDSQYAILRCYNNPKGFKRCNSGWFANATYKTPFTEFNVGDQFWVRETFCYGRIDEWDAEHPDDRRLYVDQDNAFIKHQQPIPKQWCLENNVDIEDVVWKPSIHMPRIASRILLEITKIRIERLNQISSQDAVQEGLLKLPASGRYVVNQGDQYFGAASSNPCEVFKWLWESIYGPNLWEMNPWVWVIEFKVIQGGEA